jgi:protein MpaA
MRRTSRRRRLPPAASRGRYNQIVILAAALATIVIGHSVEGRQIRATRVGVEGATLNVLVVGNVHGNEPAGERIVARLRRAEPPDGVALWLVRTANPDGRAVGSRHNARGVDLNRNFPARWRSGPRDVFYPGPRAASEPETRAVMRLVRDVRPQLGIYYHQMLGMTVRARGVDRAVQAEYARRTGLPLRWLPNYRGTAIGWQNRVIPGGTAFVVELHTGPAPATRHANAVLALSRRYTRPVIANPFGFRARASWLHP